MGGGSAQPAKLARSPSSPQIVGKIRKAAARDICLGAFMRFSPDRRLCHERTRGTQHLRPLLLKVGCYLNPAGLPAGLFGDPKYGNAAVVPLVPSVIRVPLSSPRFWLTFGLFRRI